MRSLPHRSLKPLLLLPAALALLSWAPVAAARSAAGTRPEHEAAGGSHVVYRTDQLAHAGAPQAPASSQTSGTVSTSASVAPFLTRPYWNPHSINSVFDHTHPDYSTDGEVVEFDGTTALAANGVDPNFNRGYAITPGQTNYLYYDGHNGWDFGLSYENVLAAAPGTVVIAGTDPNNTGFGLTITIDHGNGFTTRYAHLSQVLVSSGQSVSRGQLIAVSGNTGNSTGPHLHFGVYLTSSWTAIDPWGWTASWADPWPSDSGDLWLTGNPANPVPWAPTAVAATLDGNAASVRWTAPAFDGGSPITGYTVTASPGGASTQVGAGQTSAWITGLSYGTAYTFTVGAWNSVGAGPASSPSAAVTPAPGGGLANPAGSSWQPVAGTARDVAAGPDGTAWVIGTNSVPGGYGIWHWTGGGWVSSPGGAVAIADDGGGNPWVVNSAGDIYRGTPSGWDRVPGSARAVGVGANGSVWVVGTNPQPGGYGIWGFDGTGWYSIAGGAVRIAADSSGVPWVVNSAGSVYHLVNGGWAPVGGAAGAVGAGGSGAAWITGVDAVPGGHSISRWTGAGWSAVDGGAVLISVDPSGLPWVVNAAGGIYERLP